MVCITILSNCSDCVTLFFCDGCVTVDCFLLVSVHHLLMMILDLSLLHQEDLENSAFYTVPQLCHLLGYSIFPPALSHPQIHHYNFLDHWDCHHPLTQILSLQSLEVFCMNHHLNCHYSIKDSYHYLLSIVIEPSCFID